MVKRVRNCYLGLVIISPISPGVETPGYFLPSLRDCESPVRVTDNSPEFIAGPGGRS